jgi:hypothetical protein
MRRNHIKEIFDDPSFEIKNVEGSLNTIIEISKDSITDWRKYFIQNPAILDYLGAKRYIRMDENTNSIFLLKKERLSGTHAELYSYAFYINYLNDRIIDFNPFKGAYYYDVSGYDENDKPCAIIRKWSYLESEYVINIKYLSKKSKFEILFFEIKNRTITDDIIKILNSSKFSEGQGYSVIVFVSLSDTEELLLQELNSLCISFEKLTI